MTSGGAGVVTGEAVLLDVRAASFASRAVSGAIDLAIAGIALFAMVFVVAGWPAVWTTPRPAR